MIDEYETYIIPHNFSSGTVLGGETYKTRNLVEGLVLSIPPAILIFTFADSLSFSVKLSISLSIALPLLFFGISGIYGNSLTSFVRIFFRYLRNRRTLLYNPRIKVEGKPTSLESVNEQTSLPRDRALALLEKYKRKNPLLAFEESPVANTIFFEEDIGILPKPDAYKTYSDLHLEKKERKRRAAEMRKQQKIEKKAEKKAEKLKDGRVIVEKRNSAIKRNKKAF